MKHPKIYALETTNYCNATCEFCPRDKMTRKHGFVSIETVLKVFNYCVDTEQDYIVLHHMGEPLMHPQINNIVNIFESSQIKTEFSTNGMLLRKCGESLLKTGISRIRIAVDHFYNNVVYRSNLKYFLERAEEYTETEIRIHTMKNNDLSMFDGHGAIIENKSFDNWAGAIEGESTLNTSNECYFEKYNYVVVTWDGKVIPCCMDYDAKYVIGSIDHIDKLNCHNTKIKLCEGCAKMQFPEGSGFKI